MAMVFILLIVFLLLIPSLVVLFESRRRANTFYIFSILLFSLSCVFTVACGTEIPKAIDRNNIIEKYRHDCIDFIKDYQYYDEVCAQYSQERNIYTQQNGTTEGFYFNYQLDNKKLSRNLKAGDTFDSYFYNNYKEYNVGHQFSYDYDFNYIVRVTYTFSFEINCKSINTYYDVKTYSFNVSHLDLIEAYKPDTKIAEFSLHLENPKATELEHIKNEEDLTLNQCIFMLVALSLVLILNIISFIISIRRPNNIKVNQEFINNGLRNNKLVSTEHPIIENHVPEKPKWSALKDNEKQPYIEKAIKELFIKQLAEYELTRQEKALKQYSIDKNEFYIEDLNDEDKKSVLDSAKQIYENDSKDIGSSDTKNAKNLDGKLIKKGFKWVPISFIGKILGKVTSFTGEKSPYDFRYLNFGMKLVVSTLWEGYKIEKDDVLKYSIKQSSGLKERCIITLKNGKKISVDLNIGASEKVIMALGADLMDE